MFYTVYKITNSINGKIYIGAHKTSDLDDGYMGSGNIITLAIKKYGKENFEKEILEVFTTKEAMFEMESKLVTKDFIKETDNYNIKEGGYGGFNFLSTQKGRDTMEWLYENDPEWLEKKTTNFLNGINDYYEKGGKNGFFGKEHSLESKAKMSGHTRQQGEKNSQFGSMWIHSLQLKVSKKIKKEEFSDWEAKGWLKGRKMKF